MNEREFVERLIAHAQDNMEWWERRKRDVEGRLLRKRRDGTSDVGDDEKAEIHRLAEECRKMSERYEKELQKLRDRLAAIR